MNLRLLELTLSIAFSSFRCRRFALQLLIGFQLPGEFPIILALFRPLILNLFLKLFDTGLVGFYLAAEGVFRCAVIFLCIFDHLL
jgi:hypothetical protein